MLVRGARNRRSGRAPMCRSGTAGLVTRFRPRAVPSRQEFGSELASGSKASQWSCATRPEGRPAMHEHTSSGEDRDHRAGARTPRRSAHHRSTHRLLLDAEANNARRARRYHHVWDGELREVWAKGPTGRPRRRLDRHHRRRQGPRVSRLIRTAQAPTRLEQARRRSSVPAGARGHSERAPDVPFCAGSASPGRGTLPPWGD